MLPLPFRRRLRWLDRLLLTLLRLRRLRLRLRLLLSSNHRCGDRQEEQGHRRYPAQTGPERRKRANWLFQGGNAEIVFLYHSTFSQ